VAMSSRALLRVAAALALVFLSGCVRVFAVADMEAGGTTSTQATPAREWVAVLHTPAPPVAEVRLQATVVISTPPVGATPTQEWADVFHTPTPPIAEAGLQATVVISTPPVGATPWFSTATRVAAQPTLTPTGTLTATVAATRTVQPVPTSPIRKGSGLPERPATRLVIPAMGVDAPVVLAPIVGPTWKIDDLGTEKVGHLEGTASPGDPSNVVLAAHVTTAHLVYGPFAGLGKLERGSEIIVYSGEDAFTYIVDYRRLVERTDIKVVYPTTVGQVTLITCNNWSDEKKTYQERLIVVGHLAGP
jgi:LPXTG-site transpeptidase (sortase) family protein